MTHEELTAAGWAWRYDNDFYAERYERNGKSITVQRDEQAQKYYAFASGDRSRGEWAGESASSKGDLKWSARDTALSMLSKARFANGLTVREWALSPAVTP